MILKSLPCNLVENPRNPKRDGVCVLWIVFFEKGNNPSEQVKILPRTDSSLVLQNVDKDDVKTPRDIIQKMSLIDISM